MSAFDAFYLQFGTKGIPESKKGIQELSDETDKFQKKTKESQTELQKLGVSFLDLFTSISASMASLYSAGRLKDAISGTITWGAALEKQSRLTGESARNIAIWGRAVAAAGGSENAFSQYFQKQSDELASKGLADRIQNIIPWLKQFAPILKQYRDTFGDAAAKQYAGRFGIDPDTYLLLVKGGAELDKILETQTKINDQTEAQFKGWQAIEAEWKNVASQTQGLAGDFQRPILRATAAMEQFIIGLRIAGSLVADISNLFKDWHFNTGAWDHLKSLFTSTSYADFINRVPEKAEAPPAPPTGAAASNRQESYNFWRSQGYTAEQAAGMVGNEQGESNFNEGARGDSGQAHGIFQWHPARRKQIQDATGIDVSTASHMDQLKAAMWELNNTYSNANEKIKASTTPGAAAEAATRYYELPANPGLESYKRGKYANAAYTDLIAAGQSGIASADGSPLNANSQTNSVQIDNITVNTQATDADGIARSINESLSKQLAPVYVNYGGSNQY